MTRRSFLTALGGASLAGTTIGGSLEATPAAPPPFTSPAAVYSGISGPGKPAVGNGGGGWRSGATGVVYQGANPKAGWTVLEAGLTTDSAVKAGLLPPVKPLWDLHLRDTVIIRGGDGQYYMTGSSGDNIWDRNDGVELWRSDNLQAWTYLGLVWSIERDGTWQKAWRDLHGRQTRNVWAPELHYVRDNYFICLSMAPGGIALLKSQSGKPEGPYVNALAEDRPLTGGIDATLFQDDDGHVYFTYGSASKIARLKDDMTGLAEAYRPVVLADPDHSPQHHAAKCVDRGSNDIGHEGASLFKAHGRYYLGAADDWEGRYSSVVAVADSIYGPYHRRHEAVPCGGGTNYFQDRDGNWYCCLFGNDTQAPWREKPGLVRIDFQPDGRIVVAKQQPAFLLRPGAGLYRVEPIR